MLGNSLSSGLRLFVQQSCGRGTTGTGLTVGARLQALSPMAGTRLERCLTASVRIKYIFSPGRRSSEKESGACLNWQAHKEKVSLPILRPFCCSLSLYMPSLQIWVSLPGMECNEFFFHCLLSCLLCSLLGLEISSHMVEACVWSCLDVAVFGVPGRPAPGRARSGGGSA